MPTFDMFGPTQGMVQQERDFRTQDIVNSERMAQTELIKTNTALEQDKLAQQQKMQAAFARLGEGQKEEHQAFQKEQQDAQKGQSGQPPEFEDTLAKAKEYESTLWKLGMPAEAMKAAQAAANLTEKIAQKGSQEATTKLHQTEQQQKMLGGLNQLAAQVQGPEDWERMKMIFAEQNPGAKNPYATIPYDPKLIENIRQGTKEGLAKVKSEEDQYMHQNLEETRKDASEFRKWREGFLERKEAFHEKEVIRQRKEGGGDVSWPSTGMVNSAIRDLKKEYPALPPDELEHFGTVIASRAKVLTSKKAGIDPEQAIEMAMQEAKDKGDVKTVDSTYASIYKKLTPDWMQGGVVENVLGGGKKEQHYQPKGGRSEAKESSPPLPQVGVVVEGYKYLGGDPHKKSSWEKAGVQ